MFFRYFTNFSASFNSSVYNINVIINDNSNTTVESAEYLVMRGNVNSYEQVPPPQTHTLESEDVESELNEDECWICKSNTKGDSQNWPICWGRNRIIQLASETNLLFIETA